MWPVGESISPAGRVVSSAPLLIGASAIAGPIVGWAGRTPRLGAAEPAASEPVAV